LKNIFVNGIYSFIIIGLLFSCGPKTKKLIKLPTEVGFTTTGNWIFIKLKINKTDDLNFMIDNGVDETVMNKRTAEQLGYKFNKRGTYTGAFGRDSVYYSENNKIFIGNLELDSIKLVQVPLENLEQTFGVSIDGIIGEALFKKYIVNIDLEKKRIQLYTDKNDFIQKDSLFSIDLKIISKVPVIQASFILNNTDTLYGNLMVDLGYRNSVALNTPFVKKNNLISKLDKYYTFNATGIIAAEKSYMARLKIFKLGDYTMDSITYMVNQSNTGNLTTIDYDGIVGMEVLTRFASVGFDYKNKKMYLGKYNYIKDNIYSDVNCSGLELKKISSTSKVIVNAVYKNSPASEVGLKEGDELTLIKGQDVKKYELTEVKKILREKGKTIDILIKRGNKNMNFKLNLRELI